MRFLIENSKNHFSKSVLIYRADEYSFDMVPVPIQIFTSVLVNDVSLEVNPSGRLITVWGFCPHLEWIEAQHEPPSAKIGSVVVQPDQPFERGVSQRFTSEDRLPIYFDRNSGWVLVRDKPSPAFAVEVFSGVIMEISEDGRFSALWLKPRME